MDTRIGKLDLVIWTNINRIRKISIEIGKVVEVSTTEQKFLIGDGGNFDQSGEPIYSWIYPKFYPSELALPVRPDEVILVNRHFCIGDLVKRDNNEIGFVQNIIQSVTVKVLNYDLVIPDVRLTRLKNPWTSYVLPNRPILYKGWVGQLGSRIERRIYLKYDGTHNFQINWCDFSVLVFIEDVVDNPDFTYEVNGFCFYPGRQFYLSEKCIKKETMLGRIQWINTPPPINATENTKQVKIIKTELLPFNVNWLHGVNPKVPEPPKLLKMDNLKNIIWILPNPNLSLGDIRLYKMDSGDWNAGINQAHWEAFLMEKYSLSSKNYRKRVISGLIPILETYHDKFDKFRNTPVEIIHVTSKVEVVWIKGGPIEIVDSSAVVGIKNTSGFSIGSFVQLKNNSSYNVKHDECGVIQRINLNVIHGSKAIVKWIKRQNGWSNFLGENTISIEELKLEMLEPHSVYNFRSESNQNVIVVRKEPRHRYHCFKVGFVVNTFPDGMVRVCDTTGKLCNVWPDEIISVFHRQHELNFPTT